MKEDERTPAEAFHRRAIRRTKGARSPLHRHVRERDPRTVTGHPRATSRGRHVETDPTGFVLVETRCTLGNPDRRCVTAPPRRGAVVLSRLEQQPVSVFPPLVAATGHIGRWEWFGRHDRGRDPDRKTAGRTRHRRCSAGFGSVQVADAPVDKAVSGVHVRGYAASRAKSTWRYIAETGYPRSEFNGDEGGTHVPRGRSARRGAARSAR